MTQNNLGNAHLVIGLLETGVAEFERAVAAYDEALNVYTREHTPLLWAMTQYNLANALYAWGERENGTSRLERAVAAYDEARKVYHKYKPQLSAMITGKQGVALMLIAERLGNLTAVAVHYISPNTRQYNVVVEVCFAGNARGQRYIFKDSIPWIAIRVGRHAPLTRFAERAVAAGLTSLGRCHAASFATDISRSLTCRPSRRITRMTVTWFQLSPLAVSWCRGRSTPGMRAYYPRIRAADLDQ
jgi:tetratricopeptide (TPR) repeat protein